MKQSSSDTTTADIKYTQKLGNSVQDTYELSSLNSFDLSFFQVTLNTYFLLENKYIYDIKLHNKHAKYGEWG